MSHSVQYVSTDDGVGIAYWMTGEGVPLVIPPILTTSHLEMEWQIPSRRAAYEGLARRARVIHYDCRGMGMSQRDAVDFSIDAAQRDLGAIAERLGLETFALLRLPSSGDVAFAYAANNPDRVSHLVVWEGHSVQDGFDGVERCFAIQAGREVRVMVNPENVTDSRMTELSDEIARRLEEELQYPGQIKVVVIRETRAVDFAR
jgi:pimeloyl-ACP methyl ester carboxylesterase